MADQLVTDLFRAFRQLVPSERRLLVVVAQHLPDGVSIVQDYGGHQWRVLGQIAGGVPPYNAFVRAGRIEAAAPSNLAVVSSEV